MKYTQSLSIYFVGYQLLFLFITLMYNILEGPLKDFF